MPFRPSSFRHRRRSDFDDAVELLTLEPVDVEEARLSDSLSRHMAVLRRRSQSSGRWHLLAILTASLIALVMAGFFSR